MNRLLRCFDFAEFQIFDDPFLNLAFAMIHLALSDLSAPYPELREDAMEFLTSDQVSTLTEALHMNGFIRNALELAERKPLKFSRASRGSLPEWLLARNGQHHRDSARIPS